MKHMISCVPVKRLAPNLISMLLTIIVLAVGVEQCGDPYQQGTWSKSARLLIFSKSPLTERRWKGFGMMLIIC